MIGHNDGIIAKLSEPEPPRSTIDGVPVKVGDVVWRASAYVSSITKCRLYKHHLDAWWERMSKEIYSTEYAAIAGQIEREKQRLDKARREVRRATKSIERLRERLDKERAP